jgi:hypothetical protein
MPGYTVTVTRPCPNCKAGDAEGECLCADAAERHPADTLAGVRAICRTVIDRATADNFYRRYFARKADSLRAKGGTVGPLPNGDTITVEADREDSERNG